MFKLEYCPVEKETFYIKVEKHKTRYTVTCLPTAIQPIPITERPFIHHVRKLSLLLKKGLGFCGLKL